MEKEKTEPAKPILHRKLIYAVVAIIAVLVLASFAYSVYFTYPSKPRAAIIDELSSSQLGSTIRHENATFINRTRELLYERFDEVDYYRDNTTVEQYKQLSSKNYKLIVWRVHSAIDNESKFIAIATNEKYLPFQTQNNYYVDSGHLTVCNINGEYYYGITPKFVSEFMIGRFSDTVIILMSCNGLKQGYGKTAEVFQEKGVKAFISWSAWIETQDNDHAIALLLDYLIQENNTIGEAVNKILPYFYPLYDPSDTILKYYPANSVTGDYCIPDYKQTNVTSGMTFAIMPILKKYRTLT